MAPNVLRNDRSQLLNSWFLGILWLKIAFTSFAIVLEIWKIFTQADYASPYLIINTILAICAVLGAFWLTQAEKKGFYLIVIANLLVELD